MDVPMIMIPALDIIIMQNRFKHPTKGDVRRVSEVAEVAGMEGEKVLINRIFKYSIKQDLVVETGTPSRLMHDMSEIAGITQAKMMEEIDKRGKVLQWLVDNDKRNPSDLKKAILEFNRDADKFFAKNQIE
jgi:flagellar protein FlaI